MARHLHKRGLFGPVHPSGNLTRQFDLDAIPDAGCGAAQPPCVIDGRNPLAVIGNATFAVRGYGKYVRLHVTSVSGSGSISAIAYGYKGLTGAGGGSEGGGTATVFADSPNLDAFSRLRTSSPTTLFDSQFQYGLQPFLWDSVLTGTGTAMASANTSSVTMTVSANGDQVVRQSHRYMRYQPGKSQLIVFTAVMGAIKPNTRQRIGYFDAQNGVFFQQNGTARAVVQRSFTSGAAVDTTVTQANWNLDKLDGTGPSGITLDTSQAQIFVIDLQWLGVGRVRYGFDIGGVIVYCHQMLNANALPSVYMTTANLPMRYELTMTGATSATVMTQICQAVISEGGFENEQGLLFTANNGAASISVTTRRPILSIRPKTTFAGVTNRGLIIPQQIEAEIGSGDSLIEVVYNGTLTGASFASVDANSLTESDASATAITGGTVILSFYVSGGGATARNSVVNPLGPLVGKVVGITLDPSGTVPDRLSIVATSFTGSVTASAVLGWKEIY